MARTEKTSRARMLPPRVRLRREDYTTGSFPTNLRFSTDGRTGNYRVFFDDTYTVLFTSSVGYMPSVGLPTTSPWLAQSGSSDFRPMTASFLTTGSITKFVVDGLPLEMPVPGRALLPFNDTDNRAADRTSGQDPFFSTGSAITDVGEGFTSPLWSKQKIEIDISVSTPTTLTLVSSAAGVSGTSFPMAYYNFATKAWDPIGLGYGVNSFSTVADTVDTFTCGFLNSFFSNDNTYLGASMGYLTNDFGFPFHPKYHATSSQVFNMSGSISYPFLVEKAVIEMSGTWAVGGVDLGTYGTKVVSSSINTCFLLNQRKNQKFDYVKTLRDEGLSANFVSTASVPVNKRLSVNASPVYVDTQRDLMGFTQIFSVGKNSTTLFNSVANVFPDDIVITSSLTGISSANWSGPFALSMSMNTPAATSLPVVDIDVTFGSIVSLGANGYRTGLGMTTISTRGLTNDFFNAQSKRTSTTPAGTSIQIPQNKRKVNPYLLFPSDQLVLGWQMPVARTAGVAILIGDSESRMTFLTGSFKLVLYGCYVSQNKESINTTNQLLSSPAVHETIEGV